MNIVCNICKKNSIDISMPNDTIGVALMEEHFREKHPEFYEKMMQLRRINNALG